MRIESLYLDEVGPFDDVMIDFPEGKDPNLADVYLLTGPNGCGKSTVLYAIAALVAANQDALGKNLILPRLRTPAARVAMKGMGTQRAGVLNNRNKTLFGPFEGTELQTINAFTREPFSVFQSSQGSSYQDDAAEFRVYPQPGLLFNWAAFAYSGVRAIADGYVEAISDLTNNPFEDSLDFHASADSKLFVRWIAAQQFRRLKAQDSGNHVRADTIAQSISNIEKAIAEITGEIFIFDTSGDDNNVRIRRHRELLELNILPAGLQSILSWIANLLMRLDRIPWVDNTPPMQRSFLLLLDEIDIHLHPAWQRKVIPVVQNIFPKAQIIASTHSPFVVSSADDAHIITFSVKDGKSQLVDIFESQKGSSYRAVLREIFGIKSDFDIQTEEMFQQFRAAKDKLLSGETDDRTETDRLAGELASRSEEVAQLIGFELRQLDRQLAQRTSEG